MEYVLRRSVLAQAKHFFLLFGKVQKHHGRFEDVAFDMIAMRPTTYDTSCDLLIRLRDASGCTSQHKLKQKQYLNTHTSVPTMQCKSVAVLLAINDLSCI